MFPYFLTFPLRGFCGRGRREKGKTLTALLIQQIPCSIGAFQITGVLVIYVCLEVGYFVADEGRKNIYQFLHFFAASGTILDHDTVQLSNIHKTWNSIFAICDCIEIAVGDLVL